MLLPIGHEKNTVSRLPFVTVALILVNLVAFLLTTGEINTPNAKKDVVETTTHILILKARYPELKVSPEAQKVVDRVQKYKPQAWRWLTANDRKPEDAWEVALLLNPDPRMDQLQSEMDELCARFTALQTTERPLLWKYAYHSYQPTPASYITHQYLHGGWLHLISNMWMLWLCGVILEDAWGPFVVLAFYTIAGVFAAFFHGWMTPGSLVPMVGASGSIAGLMGALLARFPKLKVTIFYWYIFRIKGGTFQAPVYWLAPLWFVAELFWGLMGDSGVAHWAHVGGFIFGVAVGFALYLVKIEDVVNKEDPSLTWKPDETYLKAMDLMDQRDASGCIAELGPYLKQNPNSVEGWELMLRAQDFKGDHQGERDETLPQLIRLSFGAGDTQQAAKYLSQYRAIGGKALPAATWIELCRKYEKDQQWEAAAGEYEALGMAYVDSDRIGLTALLSAGRIYQTKLNRGHDAARMFQAAKGSAIPHLDLDGLIEQGLRQSAGSAATA